jgi:hypothetical protein
VNVQIDAEIVEKAVSGRKQVMFTMLITSKTGGSRPARRLTFFNAKKVSKKACSCGGHLLRMDL